MTLDTDFAECHAICTRLNPVKYTWLNVLELAKYLDGNIVTLKLDFGWLKDKKNTKQHFCKTRR